MNELELIEIYCSTWNTLDPSLIEAYLADDVVLDSQDVLTSLIGKSAVYDYHVKKVEAKRKTVLEYDVYAEVGHCGRQAGNSVQVLPAYESRPCSVIAQGSPQNLVGLVLLDVENDQIKKIGYCT